MTWMHHIEHPVAHDDLFGPRPLAEDFDQFFDRLDLPAIFIG
jgi:hypothetical protein